MSVRKLSFTLSAGGISPQTVQPGGVQFEHNATEAIFIIPGNLFELIKGIGDNKTVLYRVDAIDGEGGYHPSAPIEPILTAEGAADYQLTYPVPYGVSSIGGTCQLTVVATRMDENSTEEMIYCSETARIEFSHVSRSNKQHDDFKGELGGILNEAKGYMIEAAEVDNSGKLYVRYVNGKTVYVGVSNLLSADTIEAAIHAINNANVAAENAMAATNKANTAADDAAAVRREVEEGGFVESLKEMHTGSKFSFWVGTKAEYEAIPKEEIVENCFYMITDDDLTVNIKQAMELIADYSIDCDVVEIKAAAGDQSSAIQRLYYRKYSSGYIDFWGTSYVTYLDAHRLCISFTLDKFDGKTSIIEIISATATVNSLQDWGNSQFNRNAKIETRSGLETRTVTVLLDSENESFSTDNSAYVSFDIKAKWKREVDD